MAVCKLQRGNGRDSEQSMTTGQPTVPPKQWFGVYLGIVAQTRSQDSWVQVQVPQLSGFEMHTWARPMGFAGFVQDGDTGSESAADLTSTGYTPTIGTASNVALSPVRSGPGPNVGTPVFVMFVAGDLAYPCYTIAG